MPVVLSEFKLPPRTFEMADEEFEAYFDERPQAAKKNFLKKPIIVQVLLEIQ